LIDLKAGDRVVVSVASEKEPFVANEIQVGASTGGSTEGR
jgi:hypothetical protein